MLPKHITPERHVEEYRHVSVDMSPTIYANPQPLRSNILVSSALV